MLTLTADAAQTIEQILEDPSVPDGSGLRLAAAEGGADGVPDPATRIQLVVATAPQEGDEVVSNGAAQVFVDSALQDFLDDKSLDATDAGDGGVGFTLTEQG